MADKKIEISLEDKTPSGGAAAPSSGVPSQEDKQLEKLTALWKKQDEQDRKELEKLFIESNKKLWERQDREEQQRSDSAAYERALELDATKKDIIKDLIASFDEITRADENASLLEAGNLSSLEEDIEAATQELLAFVDGTEQATGWISNFSSILSSAAGAAAAALSGGVGGGGGGGGHGAKAGVFGAFGGGSAGISVGHSLAAAALNAGGALAVLTAAALAYEKVVSELIELTGGFSADVAGAQARTEIQKIEDQLKFANEYGAQVADLERIRSDINSELRGLVGELLQAFGPMLQLGGEALQDIFKILKDVLDALNGTDEKNEQYFRENSLIYIELFKEARKLREEVRFLREGEYAEKLTKYLIEGIFRSNQSELDRLNNSRGNNANGNIPNAPNFI